MILPSFKRLIVSDYKKDEQDLVNKLALSINPQMDNLNNALNKNLSFSDNILCTVRTVTIIVDSKGNPTTTTAFTLDNNNAKVLGTMVINASNQTSNTTYPTGYPFISGVQGTNIYTINNITSLQANNKYSLTIIAIQTNT